MVIKNYFKKALLAFSFMIIINNINAKAATDESNISIQVNKEDKNYSYGETIPINAQISNNSTYKINNVILNFILPEELQNSNESITTQNIGTINAGETANSNISIYTNIKEQEASSIIDNNKGENNTNTLDNNNIFPLILISISMISLIILCFKNRKHAKNVAYILLIGSLSSILISKVTVNAATYDAISNTLEESTIIKLDNKEYTIKVQLSYKKENNTNLEQDIGLETPWIYDSQTSRHKTMYDGTVVNEILFDSNEGIYNDIIDPATTTVIHEEIENNGRGCKAWGWYDKEASMQIVKEIANMQIQNNIYPYSWDEDYYEEAKHSAGIYACTEVSSATVHMSSGGLPNVLDNRKYITFGINTFEGEKISVACFVTDSAGFKNNNFYYGKYWKSYFGTYYSSFH